MRRLFIFSLLFMLLSSCNESGMGIFYSISREQPLEDTTLPNDLSVSSMVEGTDTYYVCAGGLYSRDISSGQSAPWNDQVKMPSGSYDLCLELVEFNGEIYGLFTNIDGDLTRIYKTPRNKIDWSSVGSFDNPIVSLAASGSTLFVSERPDYATYVTKSSTDGESFSAALALPEQYSGATDAVDFLSVTYLICGSKLYSGNGTSFNLLTGTDAPSSTFGFGGLYVSDSLGSLFVSNNEGQVYSTTDGSAWSSSFVSDSSGDPVKLYDISGISILDADLILVGAENGYYDIVFTDGYTDSYSFEIPGTEEAGEFSSSDGNFLNIELRTSAVRGFYVDEGNNTLFAMTSGNGMWINPISGSNQETIKRKWDRQ